MGDAHRRVLVTGGAGFIGSHLITRLVQEGYSILVLDDLSSGRLENLDARTTNCLFFAICDFPGCRPRMPCPREGQHLFRIFDEET